MSGTRGRLKEHLEGIHKNCDWILKHVLDSKDLIGNRSPKVSQGFHALGEIAKELDKYAQTMYGRI